MPELLIVVLFLKQVCLNYCFHAYVACLSPGTRRQTRAGTPERSFRALKKQRR